MGSHRSASSHVDDAASSRTARRRSTRSRRRGRTVPLLALVAALVVGTAGWALASRRSDQPTAAGCDRPAVLRVVTSESLLVPLQRAAKGFAGTARARAACATVEVRYLAPTSAADVLALAASSGSDPGFDVWVPDSSTWARVASRRPEVDRLLPDVFPVLASSPTVMAVPEPMARAAGWDDDDPTLQQLLAAAHDPRGWGRYGHAAWGAVRMSWTDVRTSTSGLDTLVTLYAALQADTSSPEQLRAGLLDVQGSLRALDAAPGAALGPLRDESLSESKALARAVALPSTRREVDAFNRTNPAIPLTPVNLRGDATEARVGYLAVYGPRDDHDRRVDAAGAFGDYLTTRAGSQPLDDAGWTVVPATATARSGSAGSLAPLPRLEPGEPGETVVTEALQAWSALDRQSAVLLAVDTSGSMNARVSKGGETRIGLARAAIRASVVSFSDRSRLGLWAFSRRLDGDRDYDVVVPLGRADDRVDGRSRREAIRAAASKLRAAGDTGLYDTALAATRDVRAKAPESGGVVVLLSDGRDDDPGSIGLEKLLRTLERERDTAHPVRVYTIAYGGQADRASLRRIAQATQGRSFEASSPADLQRVLLASLTE
ncbi:VWA domain-containing protein [Angustibacter aerolatus]